MPTATPILIGEVTIDLTLATRATGAKVRLGGVVHAARGLWGSGRGYSIGAFCPLYLVEQAKDYLLHHGCEEFLILGEITGAPNVIAISDQREIGHQGYEDLLREKREINSNLDKVDLSRFEQVVVFPGAFSLIDVLDQLKPSAHVTLDAAYGINDGASIQLLKSKITKFVISTSSKLFLDLAAMEVDPLVRLVKDIDAEHLLLKENRGGSRLFDLAAERVEHIPAMLGETANSVGVGDVFTAVLGTFDGSVEDAAWRGMQVATVYSQTTWPDDLKRDITRELNLPLDVVRGLGGVSLPWHARPRLEIYLAAPDFSYTAYQEVSDAVAALEYHNFRVRRPVKENGEADRDAPVDSLSIYYLSDLKLLRACVAVFAVPIKRDPGTLVEVGLAIEMGKPVITFDPRAENLNTMVVKGSAYYSSDLDVCLTGIFSALSKLDKESPR